MPTLLNDIGESADWVVGGFERMHRKLDFRLESLREIDAFFDEQSSDGKPKDGTVLAKGKGSLLFGIGAYVGETIVRNCPGSHWETDDRDPNGEMEIQVRLANGAVVWPVKKVMKRLLNGREDGLFEFASLLLGEVA